MSTVLSKLLLLTVCLPSLCTSGASIAARAAVGPTNAKMTTAIPANDLAMLDGSSLVDQNGHHFHTGALAGRLVLLNFIFTHCTTSCPEQTEQLVSVMHDLPDDARRQVAIVSVSVDPANDTPAAMRKFAEEQGAKMSNWYFLTGTKEDVGRLTKALGIFALVPGSPNAGRHTTDIRLFDRQGRFRQRYSGVPVDKKRLSAETQILLSARPRTPL